MPRTSAPTGITDKSAVEIADGVRSGKWLATDVLEQVLGVIAKADPQLNAFVHLDIDGARAAADRVDRIVAVGSDPGFLAGVPIGVKDNEDVAGSPTRNGSLIYSNALSAATDSVHVARLRAAGAIPVGKLAMAELGLDGVTNTRAHGVTRNPWNLQRSPGGSSGGSAAAVSAGMVPLATASDALGSIRCPAAFTGTVGFKPSLGRIPRVHGFRDTASPGAIARSVIDLARYLDVVAGPDDRDRMSLPPSSVCYESAVHSTVLEGLRVGWSPDLGFAPVDDEVVAITEKAFKDLVVAAKLQLSGSKFVCSNVYPQWNALMALELVGEFECAGLLPDYRAKISPGPLSFIDSAQDMTERERAELRTHIRRLEVEAANLFKEVDVLVTPTTGCTAHPAAGPLPTEIAGRDSRDTHGEAFTALASICWNPSISVPAGVTRNGLPVGLLITGRRHQDEVVLALAWALEQARPWPLLAPVRQDSQERR